MIWKLEKAKIKLSSKRDYEFPSNRDFDMSWKCCRCGDYHRHTYNVYCDCGHTQCASCEQWE